MFSEIDQVEKRSLLLFVSFFVLLLLLLWLILILLILTLLLLSAYICHQKIIVYDTNETELYSEINRPVEKRSLLLFL